LTSESKFIKSKQSQLITFNCYANHLRHRVADKHIISSFLMTGVYGLNSLNVWEFHSREEKRLMMEISLSKVWYYYWKFVKDNVLHWGTGPQHMCMKIGITSVNLWKGNTCSRFPVDSPDITLVTFKTYAFKAHEKITSVCVINYFFQDCIWLVSVQIQI